MRHGPHPPFLWTGHLEKQGNGNYENRNDSGFAADTAGGLDENIKNAMGQIGVQLFSRYEAEIALLELLQPHGEELWKTARWLQEKRRTVTAETEPADAAEQGALLSEAQRILLEAVERCPAAQENKNCRNYLDALDSYGKMLQTSTLIYNDTVSKFNQSIRPFPMNVAARLLHFQKKAYLEMR